MGFMMHPSGGFYYGSLDFCTKYICCLHCSKGLPTLNRCIYYHHHCQGVGGPCHTKISIWYSHEGGPRITPLRGQQEDLPAVAQGWLVPCQGPETEAGTLLSSDTESFFSVGVLVQGYDWPVRWPWGTYLQAAGDIFMAQY